MNPPGHYRNQRDEAEHTATCTHDRQTKQTDLCWTNTGSSDYTSWPHRTICDPSGHIPLAGQGGPNWPSQQHQWPRTWSCWSTSQQGKPLRWHRGSQLQQHGLGGVDRWGGEGGKLGHVRRRIWDQRRREGSGRKGRHGGPAIDWRRGGRSLELGGLGIPWEMKLRPSSGDAVRRRVTDPCGLVGNVQCVTIWV